MSGVADLRSDADLVGDARAGDHGAWSVLARRHAPRLAAYLGARLRRPDIVDGLVGESLVAAWLRLAECEDPAQFAAWLRRIGASLAMRWAREHPEAAIETPLPATRLPQAHAALLQRLDHAIGALDEVQRMALELRWRGGLAGDALAAAMRSPVEGAERLADEAEERLVREWDADALPSPSRRLDL